MNLNIAGLLLAGFLLSAPLAAHEGHDHGDEAALAPAQALPRFAVQGEELEVVGVLATDTLVIYVDQRADNAPVTDLALEVEVQGWKGVAEPDGLGAYRLALPAGALGAPGSHLPLSLSLSNEAFADLLLAELVVPAAPAETVGTAAGSGRVWLGAALLLATLGGAGFILRRRAGRKSS